MKYLEDPEERIVLHDVIQKGSVYEIDREKLPPTTPKVTDKNEEGIMMRYPTEPWEKSIMYGGSLGPLPKMDRFQMDSELAHQVLAQRIPVDELNRKAYGKAFWFVECLETEKVHQTIVDLESGKESELKNGTHFSKDLCAGEKLRTGECVEKFKENGDSHHIDLKVAKLNCDGAQQGKLGRLMSSNGEHHGRFDADKAEEEMQREKNQTVKYVVKLEENGDDGDYSTISDSPCEVEEVKLKLLEFRTADCINEEKQGRSTYLEAEHRSGPQVDVDEAQEEKRDEFDAVSIRVRKRRTWADSKTSKAQKLDGGEKRAGKTKAATKKVDPETGQLNCERYEQGKPGRFMISNSHDSDADKAKEEMQKEKNETVKCVVKLEENGDNGELQEVKVELQEFSMADCIKEGIQGISTYVKDEQKGANFDVDKAEEEKGEKFNAVDGGRLRKRTCADSKTSKAWKKRAGKTRAASKKVDSDIGRWNRGRFEKARQQVLEVMLSKNAVYGNPIRRPELRNEVLKRVGDTGLVDHLLKHTRDKVTPDGAHRLRRSYDHDGYMEFWLESADLVDIRKELGIQDPYWMPPAGWKKPSDDNDIQKSICAATIRVLKEDLIREMRKMQSLVPQEDDDEVIGATVLGICSQNPTALKEKYAELKKERSELSKSMRKIKAALIKLSAGEGGGAGA